MLSLLNKTKNKNLNKLIYLNVYVVLCAIPRVTSQENSSASLTDT